MIQTLRDDIGIHWTVPRANGNSSEGELSGNSYVLTGTLSSMSRDKASQLIRAKGGKVVSSISKNTTALIAGEKAGSKLQKAEKLGVPVLNEKQFINLVNLE